MPKEMKNPDNGIRMVFFGAGGGLIAIPLIDAQLHPMMGLGIVVILASALIFPYVTLTEEGVRVRRLIRTRLYRWTELQQVGIYDTIVKKATEVVIYHYTFALVLPGGTCKEAGMPFQDDLSSRYVIHLPVSPEIQAFIEMYYGPLDFDERNERS